MNKGYKLFIYIAVGVLLYYITKVIFELINVPMLFLHSGICTLIIIAVLYFILRKFIGGSYVD